MLIAGLDLAAEPKGTALAVLEVAEGGNVVRLISLKVGVADEAVVQVVGQVTKLGIDCALGWPIDFAEFVREYSSPTLPETVFDGGIDWRRNVAYREADREAHRITGRWPLSVSTDRLAMTALRCAGLLSKIQASGELVDRAGRGKIVEVYPAASLRLWGLNISGYRNSESTRELILGQLKDTAPWLDLGGFDPLMIKSCDAFDAVIAALAALSAALGQSTEPSPSQLHHAQIEGWLALPTTKLGELLGPKASA